MADAMDAENEALMTYKVKEGKESEPGEGGQNIFQPSAGIPDINRRPQG